MRNEPTEKSASLPLRGLGAKVQTAAYTTLSEARAWLWWLIPLFLAGFVYPRPSPSLNARAIAHTQRLASWEPWRLEPHLQTFMLHAHLYGLCQVLYGLVQSVIPLVTLLLLFRHRRENYLLVRRVFCAVALPLYLFYALYPTANPATAHVATVRELQVPLLSYWSYNPYEAFPSVHLLMAVTLSIAVWRSVSSIAVRILCLLYPLLVTFVVAATANHLLLDALTGGVLSLVAIVVCSAPRLPLRLRVRYHSKS